MAHCKKEPKQKCNPGNKEIRQRENPGGKQVRQRENPDSIMSLHPSWGFVRCDNTGDWPLDCECGHDDFWRIILPRLTSFESMTWSDILVRDKKQNHSIPIGELNKCAVARMSELNIPEEEIISLRLNGTTRLYGFKSTATFVILWYDAGHGDNDTCVCRSIKKHT